MKVEVYKTKMDSLIGKLTKLTKLALTNEDGDSEETCQRAGIINRVCELEHWVNGVQKEDMKRGDE